MPLNQSINIQCPNEFNFLNSILPREKIPIHMEYETENWVQTVNAFFQLKDSLVYKKSKMYQWRSECNTRYFFLNWLPKEISIIIHP